MDWTRGAGTTTLSEDNDVANDSSTRGGVYRLGGSNRSNNDDGGSARNLARRRWPFGVCTRTVKVYLTSLFTVAIISTVPVASSTSRKIDLDHYIYDSILEPNVVALIGVAM